MIGDLRRVADEAVLKRMVGSVADQAWRIVLGPPTPETMPDRVRANLRREHENCEILITLVQFAAIGTFAVLYELSPKGFPSDMPIPIEPVPWALGCYTIFTTIRLILALRRALTTSFLIASIMVDVAVLMVTIWSFHIQYGAPAAIYLKAPTLMYVFIMIALRTLSFQPVLVLITGIASAFGWLMLLLYAAFVDARAEITRSFADYVQSHMILMGAEFDKIVSILMVTVILAISLVRARKALLRAVTEEQAADDLSRFFAPEIAGRIRYADNELKPGEAVSRDAAILFVDLRGFTPLSMKIDPQEVMALLASYQERVVRVINECGGSIDKFLGDGILASFGASRSDAEFAAHGLRAAESIAIVGEEWHRQRREAGLASAPVACAMTSGYVMFGTVGEEARLEFTVIGEPVNLAARLEKHCKEENVRVLVPSDTMMLGQRQGFEPSLAWFEINNRTVESFEQPIDLYAVAWPADDGSSSRRIP